LPFFPFLGIQVQAPKVFGVGPGWDGAGVARNEEGAFQSFRDDNLVEFCKKAFGDSDAIKIANSVERNNKARLRSLVVNEDYRVVVRPSTLYPDYTTIEIHKK
jgi:hypothetical protein